MSGVRAHNAELTRLGLTLPGFVERNKTIASLPSLGLLTLAGMTPDRFDVEYHEIQDLRQGGVFPDGFDLVALSTFTAQLKEAWEGPQKEQINRIVQAIKAALPTANIEEAGDTAAMAYGAGGTVAFVREHGAWKIKDF